MDAVLIGTSSKLSLPMPYHRISVVPKPLLWPGVRESRHRREQQQASNFLRGPQIRTCSEVSLDLVQSCLDHFAEKGSKLGANALRKLADAFEY